MRLRSPYFASSSSSDFLRFSLANTGRNKRLNSKVWNACEPLRLAVDSHTTCCVEGLNRRRGEMQRWLEAYGRHAPILVRLLSSLHSHIPFVTPFFHRPISLHTLDSELSRNRRTSASVASQTRSSTHLRSRQRISSMALLCTCCLSSLSHLILTSCALAFPAKQLPKP